MSETDDELSARMVKEYQEEQKNMKTQKIIHEIVDKRGDDDVRKARDLAVMENFQLKVEMLKSEFPEFADKLDEEIVDPHDYEIWKSKLEEMHSQRKKPSGQASLEAVKPKGAKIYEAESYKALIDQIYEKLSLQKFYRDVGSKKFDEAEHSKLQGMADKLLGAVVTGERQRGLTRGIYAWQCFKCKKTVANSMMHA